MKIIQKGKIFLIILLLTFSTSPAAVAEYQDSTEREYITYELSIENFLSETTIKGATEPGSPVTIIIHSEKRVFETYANENGYFEITTLLPRGEHKLKVISGDANRNEIADGPDNGGWKGFRESSIEKPLHSGTTNHCDIPLTYDPFDIKLSKKSGSISRDWIENQYYVVEVENFKDTRKVVSGYKDGRWYFKSHNLTLEDVENPNKPPFPISMMGPSGYSRNTLTGTFYDTFPLNGTSYDDETWNGKPVEDGTFIGNSFDPDHGYRFYRRLRMGRWKEDPHTRERIYEYEVKVIHDDGTKKVPTYETEKYIRWKTTTYQITDHIPENWENNQITITAVPKNNYDNRITLQTQADNIRTKTENNILHSHSPVSTKLTITPDHTLQGSKHPISIKALDSQKNCTETKEYYLELHTKPKPPKENKKVSETVTDKKPTKDRGTETKPRRLIGVDGKLRDADTGKLLLHTTSDQAKVHVNVKETNFSGNAGWPTNCQYEHSQGAYSPETWHMNLRANANGYQYSNGTAKDSYSEFGLAVKNFRLLQNPYS